MRLERSPRADSASIGDVSGSVGAERLGAFYDCLLWFLHTLSITRLRGSLLPHHSDDSDIFGRFGGVIRTIRMRGELRYKHALGIVRRLA